VGADEAVALLRRLLAALQRRGDDAPPAHLTGSPGSPGASSSALPAAAAPASASASASAVAPSALQAFVSCLEWKLKQLVESPAFSSNLKQSDERRAYREIVSVLAHCDGPDLPLLCEVRPSPLTLPYLALPSLSLL